MRRAFFSTLTELAKNDERIVLLTADLGYMAIEVFADTFPDRFFNMGISEQNMIGTATGLAEAGFIPFVYSITPFSVLRPYEFIRNGPVAHRLPVRIIGGGGGIDYSTNGLTHYALEDIGVMRLLPGMDIIIPADVPQTVSGLQQTWNNPTPVYYRISKKNNYILEELHGRFTIGECEMLQHGSDLLILVAGGVTGEGLKAGKILSEKGFSTSVAQISNISFSYSNALRMLIEKYSVVVTVEDHFINGGIGTMAAESIAENNLNAKLYRCGFKTLPDGFSGSRNFMLEKNGLLAEQIASFVQDEVFGNKP